MRSCFLLFALKNVAISNYSLEKVYEGYKTLEFNVGCEEEILTRPFYMRFLVKDKLTEIIVLYINLNLLNYNIQ